MSAKWWDESRRNTVMGYGTMRGRKWVHITAVRDSGPAANGLRTLCGGMQGVAKVHSGLDLDNQAECEAWKQRDVKIPLDGTAEGSMTPKSFQRACPKCLDRHSKAAAK